MVAPKRDTVIILATRIVTTTTLAAAMFAATPITNPFLRVGLRGIQLGVADVLGACTAREMQKQIPEILETLDNVFVEDVSF